MQEEKLWEDRRELVQPSHPTVLKTYVNNKHKLKTILAAQKQNHVILEMNK